MGNVTFCNMPFSGCSGGFGGFGNFYNNLFTSNLYCANAIGIGGSESWSNIDIPEIPSTMACFNDINVAGTSVLSNVIITGNITFCNANLSFGNGNGYNYNDGSIYTSNVYCTRVGLGDGSWSNVISTGGYSDHINCTTVSACNSVTVGSFAGSNALLNVYGTVSADRYTFTSDKRLKRNIEDVTASRATLQDIQISSFNWINDSYRKTDYGFIAQNLELVLPGSVKVGQERSQKVNVSKWCCVDKKHHIYTLINHGLNIGDAVYVSSNANANANANENVYTMQVVDRVIDDHQFGVAYLKNTKSSDHMYIHHAVLENIKQIDYSQVIAYMMNIIQQQDKDIKELKEKVGS
jgi:hypothetical protein